ncbi:hypothetical protein [Endozoicomonas lisbonensis]|uniref:Thioredoxin domain-containing protein n=1 Tax=Endozoicomonas lisbonensis TaxID=3120522 RepID=A0ABV2SCR0_9GAMM
MKPVRQLGRCIILFFLIVLSPASFAESQSGERRKYARIKVEFHTRDTGLIWAYFCKTCRPIRFLFDGLLKVDIPGMPSINEKSVHRLRQLDGGAAVIVSSGYNRNKAVHVWPIKAW